ncbi:MAG TPA: ATP-binding protein, partial [Euryarchaeota archaeon]|nr:ATP-binding protein [Euryarchaeota archaeon]
MDGGPGHRTVVLQGDLDSSTAGEFDDRVSQGCPAWKGDAVVVDLSGLEYISSAGVRSLLRLERMLGAGALHLEGATGIVRDVLETTGILQPEDPWSGGSEEEVPDRASMVEVADLKVVADPECIPEILDFIGDMASSYGLSQEDSPHLRLAMEEILTSVFSYGYGNDRIHSADVVIAVGDGVIRVSVRDKGLPYNYKTLLESRSADSANILTHMRHGPLMMNLGKDGREQIVWFRLPEVTSEGPCSPGGLPPVDFDSITIHPMRPEEGIQVAQCLYDEFGYTYINDIVYYPDRFAEEVASKRMLSYTAVAPSGEVAGHLTLIKTSLLPGTAELAMGVVRRRYRKGSLMTRLTEAVMGAAGDDGLTSIYAQPVGFHPYTQRICVSDGMMPCAVNINYAGSDMAMSYYTDRRRQHVF